MYHRPVADHRLGKTDLVHTPYKYTQIILAISPDIHAVALMSVLQDKHAMCLASDSPVHGWVNCSHAVTVHSVQTT